MKKNFRKIILAAIVRKSKELTDEEILSLYHSVKEKLQGQPKPGDQALTETPGPEPIEQTKSDELPSEEEENTTSEDSIDSLLKELGLDEKEEDSTDIPNTDKTNEEIKQEEPPVQETKASIKQQQVPEITTGQDPFVTKLRDEKTEAMIEKLTERLLNQDEFSPDKFKTASQGQQLNRKDKDLMADGITKPKYSEGKGIRPPRLDDRDPNAVRYKKNDENRDSDVDSDPDLKTAAGELNYWAQYMKYLPDSLGGRGGEYYGLDIPVGIKPPTVGDKFDLGRSGVVVQTVISPEDMEKGRGGPVARAMRQNGIAYRVNCLPEGHKWL